MPFRSHGEIRYYVFDSFGAGVTQAVFTRQGGVSPAPWVSLNMGGTVGDDPQRVRENRSRAFSALGRDPATIYDVWQVHGTEVVIADAPRPPETPYRQADAILTDKTGITLFMRFADCVPILLYDPLRKVVGMAHAGWMGTVQGAVRIAIEAMQLHYGTNPADILAAIGPSIGPDHYEVGSDVVIRVQQVFGRDTSGVLMGEDSHMHFDLWKANYLFLEQAGVTHIEIAGLCTACGVGDWYSHRAENGRTGRFGAMIALRG